MTDPNYDAAREFVEGMTRAKAEAEKGKPGALETMDRFDLIVKWIPSLTDDERRRLREMLG